MAWSHVGEYNSPVFGSGSSTASVSVSAVTGNLLIASIGNAGSAGFAIVGDTGGNSWSQIASFTGADGVTYPIWATVANTTGVISVTGSVTSTTAFARSFYVSQYSGLNGNRVVLDGAVVSTTQAVTLTTTTTGVSVGGPAFAPTVTGDLLLNFPTISVGANLRPLAPFTQGQGSTGYDLTATTAVVTASTNIQTSTAGNATFQSNTLGILQNPPPASWKEIQYVQGTATSSSTSPVTITTAFSTSNTVGNLLLVIPDSLATTGSISSVVDSNGNNYSQLLNYPAMGANIYGAVAESSTPGNTVSVTWGTTGAIMAVSIAEFSGLIADGVFVDFSTTGTGSVTITSTASTASVAVSGPTSGVPKHTGDLVLFGIVEPGLSFTEFKVASPFTAMTTNSNFGFVTGTTAAEVGKSTATGTATGTSTWQGFVLGIMPGTVQGAGGAFNASGSSGFTGVVTYGGELPVTSTADASFSGILIDVAPVDPFVSTGEIDFVSKVDYLDSVQFDTAGTTVIHSAVSRPDGLSVIAGSNLTISSGIMRRTGLAVTATGSSPTIKSSVTHYGKLGFSAHDTATLTASVNRTGKTNGMATSHLSIKPLIVRGSGPIVAPASAKFQIKGTSVSRPSGLSLSAQEISPNTGDHLMLGAGLNVTATANVTDAAVVTYAGRAHLNSGAQLRITPIQSSVDSASMTASGKISIKSVVQHPANVSVSATGAFTVAGRIDDYSGLIISARGDWTMDAEVSSRDLLYWYSGGDYIAKYQDGYLIDLHEDDYKLISSDKPIENKIMKTK